MNSNSKANSYCDGLRRRNFIQLGVAPFLGLGLADVLRLKAAAAQPSARAKRDVNLILLWQSGGASQLETWDLKPEAPAEIRGTLNPIDTNVPGIQICEKLPKSARQMDKYAILRSVTHPDAGHLRACHLMLTGYLPSKGVPVGSPYNETPSIGSVIARETGSGRGIPPYVVLPKTVPQGHAAYLGASCNPYFIEGDPAQATFGVRDLRLPRGIDPGRLEDRRSLLAQLDGLRREVDARVPAVDAYYEQAYRMITSPAVQKAFDIAQEPAAARDAFGRTASGQSTLLARRLVESGVRCVTVALGSWDTHAKHFEAMETKLPEMDQAFAALVSDLHDRGLLDSTLVVMMGEFGRTPKINKDAGRDHWPNVWSLVMAGAGIRGGQVIGASDARSETPTERPVTAEDVLATIYDRMGIDFEKEYHNGQNRPIKIVKGGSPVTELWGGKPAAAG